jgi:DNA repair exonuclease SbcCD ATPase subunit
MIEFVKIRYKNVLSTGDVPIEIDFNKHKTTLIVGNNGEGKSTILDALFYALFGVAFRNVNKGQLINSINNKNMLVQLWFRANNSEYFISRGLKPTIFEIYENGNLIPQPSVISEYQEIIEKKIIKMNQKAFRQIVVLGSASFVPFMQLKAADRREVIEDLLNIQVFSTMFSLLKKQIETNKEELDDTDHKIELSEQKLSMHTKHIESLRQNNDSLIEDKIDKKKENQFVIDKHNAEYNIFCVIQNDLAKSIEDSDIIEEEWLELCGWDEKLSERLLAVSHEIQFLENNNNCPTCKQDIDDNFKKTNLEEKKIKASSIQDKLSILHVKLEKVNTRRQEIINTNQKIKDIEPLLREELKEIRMFKQFNENIDQELVALRDKTKTAVDEQETLAIKIELLKHHEQKEELIINKQVLDIASSILKDGGIKSVLIKQYVPIMNKLINKFLASLDAGYGFELDENFNESIKSRYRDEFSYNSFSEGQKMRIDISLLFTWRSIAKLRNSASTNLLIMDEILDSSLDYNGTEEFLKLIDGLTKDTNTFIISHKVDQLTDKFENVLKFELKKNFTQCIQGEVAA